MAVKVAHTGYNRGIKLLLTLGIILIILAAGAAFVLSDVLHIGIKADTQVQVPQGAGTVTLARQLKTQGIIKFPLAFRLQARMGDFDGRFQPGTVTVKPGMSYEELLNLFVASEAVMTKIAIPEGYEIRQIADKLVDAGLVDRDKFYQELDPSNYDYPFLKDLPQRENPLEGYLFPATYEIQKGATEHEIIDQMLSAFNRYFKKEYYTRAQELNMTVDQIVTLASVIERETSSDAERKKVAGVFYNRLDQKMKLQSCATIQYVLEERKANLSIADTKTESPYNTYLHEGLPVGPIASPGLDCIEAALYPEETEYLYFVMGSDGSHIFSKTYEEHLQAKKNAAVSVEE